MLRRAALDAARLLANRALQHYSASTSYLVQPAWPHHACLRRSAAPATCFILHRGFAAPAAEFRAKVWKAEPCSLQHSRPIETARDETLLKRMLLRLFGFYTRESRLLRGAKALHAAVQEPAKNPALYEALGLEKRFANTHALLCLHVWLALVRLRAEGRDGKDIAQMIYEDFQDDVEKRVHAEGVKVRVSKWLKELEMMFYGSSLAYDKALRGEGELWEALQRNVYNNDAAAAPAARALARYVQRELSCLELTDSAAIMTGQLQFSGAALPRGALGWVQDAPADKNKKAADDKAADEAVQFKGGPEEAGMQQQYAS